MRQVISTKAAPGAIGPYVQGVTLSNVTGNMIYTSGQIPLDPVSGEIPETIEAQTLRSLQNVQAIVEAAGAQVRNIIKTTVFVSDLNDFAAVNQVYNDFFTEHDAMYPARSCVEVARLPKDVKIEIEAIAAL
ncbi:MULTISPECIES: RidA family protein [Aeromonas]|uniref:RidA family protein n=1 Tax=Aeromonas TaxID=642 RepID=UPI000C6CCAB5|nr:MULTISPECIES: RidA family protein [Aeromonas]PKQ79005.1 reactive intermediate/imine deaminase [Aeromonas sobria]QLH67798.1 RidA family protein [Aeromonas veronii]TNH96497.1 reactive intermediate/imine deaminase [Aeromonas sobria]TNJ24629.1 reactive intermediate/imine deaminase [Aeromonas sobria]HEH9426001.1 RidA family protein [Aeromonas sobria]